MHTMNRQALKVLFHIEEFFYDMRQNEEVESTSNLLRNTVAHFLRNTSFCPISASEIRGIFPTIRLDEPDVEYVSLEEVNDDHDEKEFDLEDILQIQDVILREKLLNVHRLITNIESLNNNPTLDFVFKSPSPFPIPVADSDSFLEESAIYFSFSLHVDKNSLY
ncbi:hypothetical protein Tco_0151772 [Tanacetum coccineum]